ncbi:MAG: glycolate oxidase subunit GlcE [Burkholderiaceae bacterium]|nr:glycolate oxidase subunit GlcE [Burkholderiaceae bacterium]
MDYALSRLCEQVMTARANLQAIEIVGGGTKRFYGNPLPDQDKATRLDLSAISGIVTYEPSELVMTALAGTPLSEIESALAEQGQMLAFDPPRFGSTSTIGGVVASGLSGPLSFGYGPLRHYVLGAHLLDAQGRILKFGGEVMKNVAGYDVSRLLTGSLGMFGVIVQVSLKVLPLPMRDVTLMFELTEGQALAHCAGFRSKAMPIKAAAWMPDTESQVGHLAIRVCGAESAVEHAKQILGGQELAVDAAGQWWQSLRDQTAAFFNAGPVWRIAVRGQTPALDLGVTAFDLAGELRWVTGELDAQAVRDVAVAAGGHATLFRATEVGNYPPMGCFSHWRRLRGRIVQRLKKEFDPKSIFNPGRLVAGI